MNNGSAQAFATGQSTGLISGSRKQVYDYVVQHGPCTQKDLLAALAPKGKNTSTFTSRFSELADFGFIKQVGGTNAGILWATADHQPVTRKELRERRREAKIARIRERIQTLNRQLADLGAL